MFYSIFSVAGSGFSPPSVQEDHNIFLMSSCMKVGLSQPGPFCLSSSLSTSLAGPAPAISALALGFNGSPHSNTSFWPFLVLANDLHHPVSLSNLY